ncbi:MAG: hypothetical protein HOE44_06150, partial [Candidatus Marinimicrobia bacterium]|nr:hypothetical protein [Candidatus Neomarinimicrobiota bacterium]
ETATPTTTPTGSTYVASVVETINGQAEQTDLFDSTGDGLPDSYIGYYFDDNGDPITEEGTITVGTDNSVTLSWMENSTVMTESGRLAMSADGNIVGLYMSDTEDDGTGTGETPSGNTIGNGELNVLLTESGTQLAATGEITISAITDWDSTQVTLSVDLLEISNDILTIPTNGENADGGHYWIPDYTGTKIQLSIPTGVLLDATGTPLAAAQLGWSVGDWSNGANSLIDITPVETTGTENDDWITGTDGNDTIAAGAGDDLIHWDAGTDTIDGDAGWDTLIVPVEGYVGWPQADDNGVLHIATEGFDATTGTQGSVDIYQVEQAVAGFSLHRMASDGSTILETATLTNVEEIKAGYQTIQLVADSYDANEWGMQGTPWDDSFVVTPTQLSTLGEINGQGGSDTLTINLGSEYSAVTLVGGTLMATLGSESVDVATVTPSGSDGISLSVNGNNIGIYNIESIAVVASDGTQTFGSTSFEEITFYGNDWQNYINGTGNDDTIDADRLATENFATQSNDWINGEDGDDVINAGAGEDTIQGGAGNDTIDGGSGRDTVSYDANQSDFTIASALSVTFGVGSLSNTEATTVTLNFASAPTALALADLSSAVGAITDLAVDGSDSSVYTATFTASADIAADDMASAVAVSGYAEDAMAVIDTRDEAGLQSWQQHQGVDIISNVERIQFWDGSQEFSVSFDASHDDSDWAQNNIYGTPSADTIDADQLAADYEAEDPDNTDLYTARDRIEAGAGDDTILAGDGGDEIKGGAGDDTIDGGGSSLLTKLNTTGYQDSSTLEDRAVYDGIRDNFTITKADGTVTVVDNEGNEGTDTLTNIDVIRFGDWSEMRLTSSVWLNWEWGEVNGEWQAVSINNVNIEGSDFSDVMGLTPAVQAALDSNAPLYDFSGDDHFEGRGGADTYYGGAGNDTVRFEGLASSYSYSTTTEADGSTTIHVTRGDITEDLYSIENLSFDDQHITLAPRFDASNDASSWAQNYIYGGILNDVLDADAMAVLDENLPSGESWVNVEFGGETSEHIIVAGDFAAGSTLTFQFDEEGGRIRWSDVTLEHDVNGDGSDWQNVASGEGLTITAASIADGSYRLVSDQDHVWSVGFNVGVEATQPNTYRDWIDAGAGDDIIDAGQGGDTIRGGAGNDIIDGGDNSLLSRLALDNNNDTWNLQNRAEFDGKASRYEITELAATAGDLTDEASAASVLGLSAGDSYIQVEDLRSGSPDGTDYVVNIDVLQFSDKEIRLTPNLWFNDAWQDVLIEPSDTDS